jgi:hypothetical protein
LTPSQIIEVIDALVQLLGPLFTVLYETPATPSDAKLGEFAYVNPKATGPHLHLQLKKGTVYPPTEGTRV